MAAALEFELSGDSLVSENQRANRHTEKSWKKSTKHMTSDSIKSRLLRKGVRCWYCNIFLTVDIFSWDHIIPRSKGGSGRDNYVPACKKCNEEKGDSTDGWSKDCRKQK